MLPSFTFLFDFLSPALQYLRLPVHLMDPAEIKPCPDADPPTAAIGGGLVALPPSQQLVELRRLKACFDASDADIKATTTVKARYCAYSVLDMVSYTRLYNMSSCVISLTDQASFDPKCVSPCHDGLASAAAVALTVEEICIDTDAGTVISAFKSGVTFV